MKLNGKVALVTGSSRGIGKAIALRLARDGADIAVNDLKMTEDTQRVVESIQKLGRRAHAFPADVARVDQVQRAVNDAVAHFGKLDILVNNAGVEKWAPFWEVTEADYDWVLGVNLKGLFFGSQAMVRHLREAKRPGRIINISSVHEDVPFPNFAAYCAAKGGVRMLTRNLAVELQGTGITVNGIAPGAIETDINRALINQPAKLQSLLRQIPAGRLGQPDQVAAVAAFLASDEADYVTGSTYYVDGGLSVFYEEQ